MPSASVALSTCGDRAARPALTGSPEVAATDLADQFLVCVEGSIVLARIYDDPGYLRRGLEQFRRCLDNAERRGAVARAPS